MLTMMSTSSGDGRRASRPHRATSPRDIDLLIVDPHEETLDYFLSEYNEVEDKRSPHKRAYTTSGVLVELFIVHHINGQWSTTFWDDHVHVWPALEWDSRLGLPVAPAAAVLSYREAHDQIHGG